MKRTTNTIDLKQNNTHHALINTDTKLVLLCDASVIFQTAHDGLVLLLFSVETLKNFILLFVESEKKKRRYSQLHEAVN